MQITTQLKSELAQQIFQDLWNIVPKEIWDKRIVDIMNAMRADKYLATYHKEQHNLELAYHELKTSLEENGQIPWPPATVDQLRFYAFASTLTQVYAQSDDKSQKRLAGSVRGYLKGITSLRPIAFEMKVIENLALKPVPIVMHDLLEGGYDYSVNVEGIDVAVECKCISSKTGMKAQLREFVKFVSNADDILTKIINKIDSGIIVRVEIPDRLEASLESQQGILNAMQVFAETGKDQDNEFCKITSTTFNADELFSYFPIKDFDDLHLEPFHKKYKISGRSNLLGVGNDKKRVVIVSLASEKPNTVLAEIKNTLDEAGSQLKGTDPAIICAQLDDFTPEQWDEYYQTVQKGKEAGLLHIALDLFKKRPYLHSISLTSHGALYPIGFTKNKPPYEMGGTMVFRNDKHPLYENQAINTLLHRPDHQ